MTTQAILLKPWLTEKATQATERDNKVTFKVYSGANKHQIRDAVKNRYKVDVKTVRTLTNPGKLKRRGQSVGKRPNWKKAIVTLANGQVIDFFAAE